MEGKYTDAYLTQEGAAAPKFSDAEMKAISSPLDFLGLNVYTPEYVRADDSPADSPWFPVPCRFRTWHLPGYTSGRKSFIGRFGM